ncbi:hypothetical protein KP79_PYT02457 [Mizuhopecten yessoensis]|uniref:C2H2-type domain-containing protein n=1 Tax=Mizuhopecten yessoensis TaxID=6573 RepID=A0A210PKI2_MIZYE|nr:hypothetical protein KP79_PYT02457 [Mizuhopecten yessoensis]
MACPVPGCGQTVYPRLGRYLGHWTLYHVPRTTLVGCDACRMVFRNRNKAQLHARRHVPEASLTIKKRPNDKFRDPGDVIPPRPPIARSTQIQAERRAAQEARRRQKPVLEDRHGIDREQMEYLFGH